MKLSVLIALLAAVGGICAGQEPRLPAVPTREEVLALPVEEQESAREAVKRVLLHRTLRQKDDAARLTTANAAECLELAQRLHAPEALVHMLELEAGDCLSGRLLHDYREAFNALVAAYGVDMLQMRLYSENQAYTTAEMRRVFEWLPLKHVFNLVPTRELDAAAIETQFMTLGKVFSRMAEVYAGVSNREQADAAAEALLPLLADYDRTSPVRLLFMVEGESPRLVRPFALYVQSVAVALVEQRRRLVETGYYGSRRLATLDYLLN